MLTVSVVTTSFNQVRFLERAILSVLEQNYPELEYIVLDPGSTDGSRGIIERYRDRITKIIFDRDSGPADALNCGLAQATGDICAYINSDDALLPGAVSKAVKAFERHPEVDIIYAHGYMVDGDDRILRRVRSTPFDLRRYLYGGVSVFQQSTFFKRSAFVAVDGFNPETRVGWDGELLVRFARARRKFHLVNDTWAVFRIHPGSMTGSRSRDDEYYKLQRRLFVEVLGHEPARFDSLVRVFVRLERWLRNPATPALRIVEKLIGPPPVALLSRFQNTPR